MRRMKIDHEGGRPSKTFWKPAAVLTDAPGERCVFSLLPLL
jgi:hypothetical protein